MRQSPAIAPDAFPFYKPDIPPKRYARRKADRAIIATSQHFDALPAAQLLMICPACGKEHWWTEMKPTLVEADRRDRALIASAVA